MIDHFITIEMLARGCEAELHLNDVPFGRCDGRGQTLGAPVHLHLVEGRNEIALLIRPGALPGTFLAGDDERRAWDATSAEVSVKLARHPRGTLLGGPDGVVLAELTWNSAPPRSRPYPAVTATQVDLGPSFGRWAWQDGEPLSLGPALDAEVRALLEPLMADMADGLFFSWIKAQAIGFAENDRAYEKLEGSTGAEALKLIEMDRLERRWSFDPPGWDALALRSCGRGRLVQVLALDGRPFLRTSECENGALNYFPAMLARLDGELKIVR